MPGIISDAARFNVSGDGKRFKMSFVEPGPISYREMRNGTIELLRKPVIDTSVRALIGQPVTCGHPKPEEARTDDEIKSWARANTIGTIESVTYNSDDGWYWAEGSLSKPEAVRSNAAPSVVFFARGYGSGGKYHGIPYGRELTAVEFDHIGLVPNPRFESATFRFNSLPNSMTNPIKWLRSLIKKEKNAEGVETDVRVNEEGTVPDTAVVDLGGGVTATLKELIANHTARVNAAPKEITLNPDDEIQVGESKVKLSDLVAGEAAARLNAAEIEKAKKDKEAADAETARLNAEAKKKEGDGFFVRLNAAKVVAADPFAGTKPDDRPISVRQKEHTAKLFGPPSAKA